MKKFLFLLLIFCCALPCMELGAQSLSLDSLTVGPVYDSIVGTNDSVAHKFRPAQAIDIHQGSGKIIMVWTERDEDFHDVWVAVYDKDFHIIDSAVRIHNLDTADQVDPAVKVNQQGDNAIVTWASTSNTTTYDVYTKKISLSNPASVTSDTLEVLVNDTNLLGRQRYPLVAIDYANSEFIIAFQDLDGNDGVRIGSFARRFDYATLTAKDTVFIINDSTTDDQIIRDIVINPHSGDLMTLCQSKDYHISGRYQLVFRPFTRDTNGNWVGGTEAIVNGDNSYDHEYGYINLNNSTGEFIICWRASPSLDGSGYGSYAVVWDEEYSTVKSQFLVNEQVQSNQHSPVAVWDEATGEAVFFYHYSSFDTQTVRYQIFDPDFDGSGTESEGLYDPNASGVIMTTGDPGFIYTAYNQTTNQIYLAYNVYKYRGLPTSWSYVRRFEFNVSADNPVYAELSRRMNAGFHQTDDKKLRFRYRERYFDNDTLDYAIYNMDHEDVTPDTVLINSFGDNWYEIDLYGDSDFVTGDYYVLRIQNQKGDAIRTRFIVD